MEKLTFERIAEAVRSCGTIMLEAEQIKESVIEKEGRANFVTAYDNRVQQELEAQMAEILPEAVFLGEEGDEEKPDALKGLVFIADPIDGTTNFIKGYRQSAISLALAEDGEVTMGVIYNPYTDELFSAQKGGGAFLNGEPIRVSSQTLEMGIVVFGTALYYRELTEPTFRTARAYFDKALDIRRSGSAAVDLCTIAAGRAELFFECKLQPWDYAAGSLIVQEAGGTITTMDHTPITLDRPCSILAYGSGVRPEDTVYEK